ncbi:MAG: STAS domain-containing protein [Actinobacteria bacterium]|nr:STAS domain-containing protein [Actinomycetota bacterium]
MSYKTIQASTEKDITIIKVMQKRIFLEISDQFRDEVISVIEDGGTKLIFDLSQVHVMNSSGLGVLMLARDKIEKRNGKIIICCLMPLMDEIFTRMRFTHFFEITKDFKSALEKME